MDNKDDTKKYKIIVIILIIILLLLLFFIFYNLNNKRLPENDVPDVFEISIGDVCKKDDSLKVDNSTTKKDDSSKKKDNSSNRIDNPSVPVFNEDEDDNHLGMIYVDDKNGDYIYQQNLKIFENKYFGNKIAPGASSTYNFKVHNNATFNIKYKFLVYEAADYKINLKYRLKKNGNYIVGSNSEWVSAEDLSSDYMDLDANRYDNYSLDWKWEYDDGHDYDDTIAGENMRNYYKLNIRFYIEQV